MLSTIGFVVAFALIMYLSIKRVSIARVMFAALVIVAATSGKNLAMIFSTVKIAFIDKATLELAGAVLGIGVFSVFMKTFGFLDKTVTGLTAFLGNVKAAVMSIPALIGSMPVLGGAALSAPLVDKLGDPLNLGPDEKAAANLAFRHGTMFIVPFSANLILSSKLTGFTLGQLISRLWPTSVLIWVIGYFALLRGDKRRSADGDSESAATKTEAVGVETSKRLWGLGQFVLYGGPLLLALVVGLAFGMPLWLAMVAGMLHAIVLGLIQKKPLPNLSTLIKGANLSQVVAMFWIMSFKEFVVDSPVFPMLISKVASTGISAALMAIVIPMAFGFGSASQTTTLAVLVPLLVPATGASDTRLYLTCLVYLSSFTAYFFSPLHMCQILTCEYFNVNMAQVWRRNWPLLAGFSAVLASYYFLAGV